MTMAEMHENVDDGARSGKLLAAILGVEPPRRRAETRRGLRAQRERLEQKAWQAIRACSDTELLFARERAAGATEAHSTGAAPLTGYERTLLSRLSGWFLIELDERGKLHLVGMCDVCHGELNRNGRCADCGAVYPVQKMAPASVGEAADS